MIVRVKDVAGHLRLQCSGWNLCLDFLVRDVLGICVTNVCADMHVCVCTIHGAFVRLMLLLLF